MSDPADIEYVATQIVDCGIAFDIAEAAFRMKELSERLDSGWFRAAYQTMRSEVIKRAGLERDFALVDSAISSLFTGLDEAA